MLDSSVDSHLQNLHPLLLRQLKNHLKMSPEAVAQLMPDWQMFLQAVSQAYDEFEADNTILERSLELSSRELLAANTQLQALLKTVEAQVEKRTQALSESHAALAQTLQQLQETQLQLIQTEKMSSLGQMVAGIAHEVNNPLNFIQGNLAPLKLYFQALHELLTLYQTAYPHPPNEIVQHAADCDLEFLLADLPHLLTSMEMGTKRVQNIVVSLRNFSRMDESAIKDVNIHEGIDSTLLILNHRIKQGIEVIKDYGDLPLIRCFPAQLNQVFTNIIANALDAMAEIHQSPQKLVLKTCCLSKQEIQIRIADNGPGIPQDVKSKIFDPFFTTKPIGKGTGLGLGISFKIIQQHQGTIQVNSEVGKGTEFIITLPVNPTLSEIPHPTRVLQVS